MVEMVRLDSRVLGFRLIGQFAEQAGFLGTVRRSIGPEYLVKPQHGFAIGVRLLP